MILYYGSKYIIKNPEFGKGNSKNDYDLGFYCPESLDLAKEWAYTNNDQNGFANKYELDVSNLKILYLRTNDFSILNWIAILLNNRTFDTNNIISKQVKQYLLENFLIDINGYDVIIGYRADDSYYSFAKDYINNVISTQQLEKLLDCLNLSYLN